MLININLKNFEKNHKRKKNQIIFHKSSIYKETIIENAIDNFLIKKKQFYF